MNGIALLFKFMTRLPVGFEPKFDSDNLGKSMKFFPIVGMVMGIILFGFYWGLSYIIYSPMVMAVILVIIEVILTGGLHLDGLADTFDGIFSYRSKQKMLDIMKDSRLGTNGGLVLILYFILKVALIYELEMVVGLSTGVIFLLIPAFARLNSVINCASAPYARATGMGKTFVDHTNSCGVLVATVLTLIYGAVVCKIFMLPYTLLITIPVLMVLGYIFSKLMTRKIGGITGDTLGAVVELSEVIGIFILYVCTAVLL